MSEFAAWLGEARARWSLGPDGGEVRVHAGDPLRALYKLRRQIPKPIRPRRRRLYQLCWEAVYVNSEHDIWVTRPIAWLHREHRVTADDQPATLEISVRITNH